jgi:hypothetical protein
MLNVKSPATLRGFEFPVQNALHTEPTLLPDGVIRAQNLKSNSGISAEWRGVVHMLLEVFGMFVTTVLSVRGIRRHRQTERTQNDQQNKFFHMRRPSLSQ